MLKYKKGSLLRLAETTGSLSQCTATVVVITVFHFSYDNKVQRRVPWRALIKTEVVYARAKERVAQHGVRGARPRLGDTYVCTEP